MELFVFTVCRKQLLNECFKCFDFLFSILYAVFMFVWICMWFLFCRESALRAVCRGFDKNGDGTIDKAEMKAVFNELKPDLSDSVRNSSVFHFSMGGGGTNWLGFYGCQQLKVQPAIKSFSLHLILICISYSNWYDW